MFSICPECANDKLKVKDVGQRDYDATTGRMSVNGDAVEYHCRECGWTVIVDGESLLEQQSRRVPATNVLNAERR